jgi:hypothetical protein
LGSRPPRKIQSQWSTPLEKPQRPAEAVAAFDLLRLAHRHVGRGDQRAAVLAPNVALGLLAVQRQLPVVHADHAVDPGGGHATLGQRHLNPVEHARVELVAAPALGLQHAEQARSGELAHGFGRHHARFLGRRSALGEFGARALARAISSIASGVM